MNQRAREGGRFEKLEPILSIHEPGKPAAAARPLKGKSPWGDAAAAESLEQIKESLVLAYLAANQNLMNIPLKAFLDGFEKRILLACLRLTHGSQKNAAALLNLKPTALFEKMRKHGIRSQRGRLSGETWTPAEDPAPRGYYPGARVHPKHAAGVL